MHILQYKRQNQIIKFDLNIQLAQYKPMKSDNLYEQFKRKQYQKQLIQQFQLERIKALSSGKKANHTSNKILLQKFIASLDQFEDRQVINLDQSIPILYQTGIFKVLSNMRDAQQKMKLVKSESEIEHSRLKSQAKFVYFLWKMIDEEQIETRVLKQILIVLYQKQNKTEQISQILKANFRNKEDVQIVIDCWKLLSLDKHYYSNPIVTTNGKAIMGLNFDSVSNAQKERIVHLKQSNNHSQAYKNKTMKIRPNSITELNKSFENQNKNSKDRHMLQNKCLKASQETINRQILSQNNHHNLHIQDNQKSRKHSGIKQTFWSKNQDQSDQNQNPFQVRYEMTAEKTKELVQRLYRPEMTKIKQQRKRLKDQQKMQQQLQSCTFKPNIDHTRNHKLISRNKDRDREQSLSTNNANKFKNDQGKNKQSKSIPKVLNNKYNQNLESTQIKPIKGYQKTVQRLRTANQRKRQQQQLRQHKGVGENYQKLKQKGINPPKFLSRKKQEQQVLFMIEFDLGRHKVKVKIRPDSTEEEIAKKLCQIYSLKSEYYQKICEIVRDELEQYYMEQERILQ